MKRFYAKIKPL